MTTANARNGSGEFARSMTTAITGQAEGVVGQASGQSFGNAFHWVYRFALKVGGSTWEVTFDDWLYLQGDNVLINRAALRKFGFAIGEVTLVFQKPGKDTAMRPAGASKLASRTAGAGALAQGQASAQKAQTGPQQRHHGIEGH